LEKSAKNSRKGIKSEILRNTTPNKRGSTARSDASLNSIAGEMRVSAYRIAFEIKGVEGTTSALLRPGFFRLALQKEFEVPAHHEVWGQGDLTGRARAFN